MTLSAEYIVEPVVCGLESTLVSTILDRFIDEHASTKRESGRIFYTQHVRKHLKPYFGDRPADTLRRVDFFRFGARRLEGLEPEQAARKFSSVLNSLSTFRVALNWYWEEEDIDARNPSRHISKQITILRRHYEIPTTRRREAYTAEHIRILLGVAAKQDPITYAVFALGAGVGLRLGEICGLEWKNIDWPASRLTPVHQLGKDLRPILLKSCRPAEPRLVPAAVMQILKDLYRTRGSQRWVFAEPGRVPISPKTIQKRIRRVRQAAVPLGVPLSISFHGTRHAWASAAIAAGWDWESLRRQLSHHSSAFSAMQYVHPVERDLPEITLVGGAEDAPS